MIADTLTSRSAPDYRADIDGLRAVAVLGVVLYHAAPQTVPGGFAGVDVFFVISGFLITRLLLEQRRAATLRLGAFYVQRARRIFPALLVLLTATCAAGWLILLPDEFREVGRQISAGVGFASNFLYLNESGYFDAEAIRKPLLHLWSLAIEEQFYIVWPICLFWLSKKPRVFLSAMIAMLAASFALNVALRAQPMWAFYLPFTRCWELLVGCILASRITHPRRERTSERSQDVVALISIGLIACAFVWPGSREIYSGYLSPLPVLGAAGLIAVGPATLVNRALASRGLVLIGLISYPLYLWHWPLLSLAHIAGYRSGVTTWLLVALAFVLAWFTWRYVETPIRSKAPGRALARVTLGMAVVALAGLMIQMSNGVLGRATSARAQGLIADIEQQVTTYPCAAGSSHLMICAQSRPGPSDAAVVGDSHALTLLHGLAVADPSRTWLAIGNPSCPPVIGVFASRPDRAPCGPRMAEALTYLDRPDSPRLVVLAFFGYLAETTDVAADQRFGTNGPSAFRLEGGSATAGIAPGKETALYTGLKAFIARLLRQQKDVVFAIDVPELPFSPRDCIPRPVGMQRPCVVARKSVDARQAGIRRIGSRLQTDFGQLRIFDPLSVICGTGDCEPIGREHSWYADSHHLSVWGSAHVARALVAQLSSVR